MARRYFEYSLSNINSTSIASSQLCEQNQAFILNGYLGNGSFGDFGYLVTINSASNLTGISFEIIGYQDGKIVNDKIDGLDNTTAYSTKLFNSVISVVPSLNTPLVSIGTGLIPGKEFYSPPISIDFPYRKNISCVVGVSGETELGITTDFAALYNVYVSINDIRNNNKLYSDMIDTGELMVLDDLIYNLPYIHINTPFSCCVLGITVKDANVPPNTIFRFSQSV